MLEIKKMELCWRMLKGYLFYIFLMGAVEGSINRLYISSSGRQIGIRRTLAGSLIDEKEEQSNKGNV